MNNAYLNYLRCAFATRDFSEIARMEKVNNTYQSDIISGAFEYRSADAKVSVPCPILAEKLEQNTNFKVLNKDQKIEYTLEYTSNDRYMLFIDLVDRFRNQFLLPSLLLTFDKIKAFSSLHTPLFDLKIKKSNNTKVIAYLQESYENTITQAVCTKSWRNSEWFKETPTTKYGRNNLAICKIEQLSNLRITSYIQTYLKDKNNTELLTFAKAIGNLYSQILAQVTDMRNQFLSAYMDIFWNQFLKAIHNSSVEQKKSAFANWYTTKDEIKANPDIVNILQKNLGVFYPAFFDPKIYAKFIVSQILIENLDTEIESGTLKTNISLLKTNVAFRYLVEQKILFDDFNEFTIPYLYLPSPFQGLEAEEKKFNDLLYNCGNAQLLKDAMRLALGVGGAFSVFYLSKNKPKT